MVLNKIRFFPSIVMEALGKIGNEEGELAIKVKRLRNTKGHLVEIHSDDLG